MKHFIYRFVPLIEAHILAIDIFVLTPMVVEIIAV